MDVSSMMEMAEKLHELFHPISFRIMEQLKQKPMHINEISSAIGVDRRLVSYHLQKLELYGLVSSKYEISEEKKSKGKALKIYKTTEKVGQTIANLKEKWTIENG